jgi:glycosyltransferase involved in cell wall biosynthesis
LKKLIRISTVALSLDVLLKGQLDFLNKYYNVIAVSGNDSHLETVSKREKVSTIDVKMQRQISPFNDLISLIKLYNVFRKEKPDIVHSITPKAGLLGMTAAYFAGVPIRIHTFTGLVFPTRTGIMQKILILMDKILCKFATNIYPEGEGVKQDLLNYRITNKPLNVIANGNVNGLDLNFFDKNNFSTQELDDLKIRLNIDNEEFIFIFVGRLVADKGINELVKAFIKISETNKNSKLLLVGPFEDDLDPLEKSTLEVIKSNSSIISVGYQNDVRPYFAISNALVFPSYREGFPNVVMQAGAMNLPSIVSNINGCNEIIIPNENGIIIPVKNQEKLYDAMLEMISNEKAYLVMKNNARKLIESRYSQELVWKSILEEYKKYEQNV